MSESSNVGSANSENVSDIPAKSKIPPEALEKDFWKQKERLKQVEQERNELAEKLKAKETEEDEKKGNYAKLLDDQKKQNAELAKQLKTKDYKFTKSKIDDAIRIKAIEKGCRDVKAFTKLIDPEKINIIEVDENFNPDSEMIEKIIEETANEYESLQLFKKDVKIADVNPKGGNNIPVDKPKAKTQNDIINEYAKQKGWA